jgi:hypothetical protein
MNGFEECVSGLPKGNADPRHSESGNDTIGGESLSDYVQRQVAKIKAERVAMKAKLASINYIAMSLFVRSTSSEVTGEMAKIGRLSRADGI